MNNNNHKDIKQVDFISELLQYGNIIFKKGNELQKSEALDLLFELMEEIEEKQLQCNNLILFPNLNKNLSRDI